MESAANANENGDADITNHTQCVHVACVHGSTIRICVKGGYVAKQPT